MIIEKQQEKLRSRNFTKFGLDLNIFVSIVTAILVLGFIIIQFYNQLNHLHSLLESIILSMQNSIGCM